MSSDADRKSNVFCARLAEQGDRFDDMIKFMVNVVKTGKPLNRQERNLLSVGFRNAAQARRTAYRTLQTEITKFEGEAPDKKATVDDGKLLKDYKE